MWKVESKGRGRGTWVALREILDRPEIKLLREQRGGGKDRIFTGQPSVTSGTREETNKKMLLRIH